MYIGFLIILNEYYVDSNKIRVVNCNFYLFYIYIVSTNLQLQAYTLHTFTFYSIFISQF